MSYIVGSSTSTPAAAAKVVVPADETENITRWIVDQAYRKEQERLKIPFGKWFNSNIQFYCFIFACFFSIHHILNAFTFIDRYV